MCDIESNSFGHFEGIGAEQVRLGFIRKVYGIVACQVSVTALAAALACGPLQHPMVAMAVNYPTCFHWGSLLATGLALLLCYTGKNSYPLNFYGLCFLTAVIALDIAVLSATVAAVGLGALLAEAAVITALLVTGLTVYTFRLLSCIFPSLHTGVMGLVVSFLGAGIFCAYLVFDTWRIAHELQVDDYIEGAVQLYMDIVNIFIYILDILMQLSKGDRN